MKILKRIVIFIGIILFLLFVTAFFLPSKYHVERSLVIKATPETIFPHVNNLHEWEKWTPWNKSVDSTFTTTYEGPEQGAGAIQKWEAKKLGMGILKITESVSGKTVKYDLNLENDKFKATGYVNLALQNDSSTKVTWADDGDLGFNPIARYLGLMFDKIMGPDFEIGLHKLDSLCNIKPEIKI